MNAFTSFGAAWEPAADPALARLFHEARAERRQPLTLDAHLRTAALGKFPVRLINVSRAGFCAQSEVPVAPGSFVVLTLASFEPLCGTVVWNEPDMIGCRFVEPLHAAIIAHLARIGVE